MSIFLSLRAIYQCRLRGGKPRKRPGARCSAALGEKYEDKTDELAVNERKCDQCGQRFGFFFFFSLCFIFFFFPSLPGTSIHEKKKEEILVRTSCSVSRWRLRTLLKQVLWRQSRCRSSLLFFLFVWTLASTSHWWRPVCPVSCEVYI